MFTRAIAVVFTLMLTAGISRPLAGASSSVPSDEAAVTHALNRLTFGIRAGDVARVKAMGLEKWIDLQLSPSRIDDKAVASKLARLETLTLDSATIQREYSGPAMVERRERKAEEGATSAAGAAGAAGAPNEMRDMPNGARGPVSETQRKDRQVIADIEEAKLLRAIYSERQLEEVLVDFWFNHFNVFAGKGATRNYLSEYEREAIRPYVLGNFRDMLEATAKSPAMLFYLDNWQNTDASSPGPQMTQRTQNRRRQQVQGQPPRRSTGLNENYARELMELHTLGVDGGYTQADIVNVARAFTGWTIKPREGSGTLFVERLHDNKEKTVLGQTIKAGGGESDADRVLDILAAHPSTARYLATKLVTRFVSDTPPKALVDRAAARFTATRGDLRDVVRTIVTSPEFFAADTYRTKVKTPFEFVVSALRETGADVRTALPLARELRDMGMPLYFCQPPTGYDDTATTWVSAGALVSRMNFAVALGKNELRGVRISNPPADLATTIGSPAFQRQ
jgi:uncharacterized protein (DUF1800 family)